MPGAHKEGLLGGGMATSEGKHLYHETLPAVIVYTSDQEANARANGYEDEYIHQEYPRYDPVEDCTFKSAEHERQVRADWAANLAPAPAVVAEFRQRTVVYADGSHAVSNGPDPLPLFSPEGSPAVEVDGFKVAE